MSRRDARLYWTDDLNEAFIIGQQMANENRRRIRLVQDVDSVALFTRKPCNDVKVMAVILPEPVNQDS